MDSSFVGLAPGCVVAALIFPRYFIGRALIPSEDRGSAQIILVSHFDYSVDLPLFIMDT